MCITAERERIVNNKHNGILQQIFTIPIDGEKYIVYAPLKGIAFICNSSLVNAVFEQCSNFDTAAHLSNSLSSNSSSIHINDNLAFLENLDFFKPEPLPVDEYEQKGIQYDAVVLFLTNQCNLRCTYCYASSGEHKPQQMQWDLAKDAIDFVMNEVIKNHSSSMSLGFHGGGEPTLNWNVLTKATEYAHSLARKNKIQLHVTGAFNGYWPKEVLQYVIKNFTEISLSFDGIAPVQNLQRPAINNKDSFSVVTETLRALDEAQFSYGIRMTVTNDSVHDLAKNISFMCENFKPQNIQVEPAFYVGRAKRNKSTINDLNTFIDQFIRGFKEAEKHHVTFFYSGARIDSLIQRFCLAACRALVVTPDGDITTCFEIYSKEHPLSQHFIVGNYKGDGAFFIDNEKLHHHFSRTIERIPHCEACFCKWHCAGDCEVKTYSEEKNGDLLHAERCFVNQELTKFLLIDKIKESGGLIWVNKDRFP